MLEAKCLACGKVFELEPKQKKGDIITCPSCQKEMELIRRKPPLLDWPLQVFEAEEYVPGNSR